MAQTTSWSPAPFATPPTRAPPPPLSRRRLGRFSPRENLLKKTLQQLMPGQHGAIEKNLFAAFDLNGREILHFQVAHLVGVVLGVEPDEFRLRECPGQRLETRPVFDAGVAPQGAHAGDAELLHARLDSANG